MRVLLTRALPCLLAMPMAGQMPLTYPEIQAKARTTSDPWRREAVLAERQLQLAETRGFLREGPTLAVSAGPRRTPGAATSTDQGFEIDLPLFLSPGARAELLASLGQAHPLLVAAASRERGLRLRTAYLDAWLAQRLLALRESDLSTVERWLRAAQNRVEAGADPAFQVALVQGECLKLQQDLDEARTQAARSWGGLAALAEVPAAPVPLADPGAPPALAATDLPGRLRQGPLRQALLAQVDLEERGLRLKEAQALNRWSLRGSYAQEGDEKVTRFGVAVRLPRPGERAAIQRQTQAQLAILRSEGKQALTELDARAQGALARLRQTPVIAALPDFTQAIAAVGLRLEEGRERPSEALPIRRQLLEAQMAALRRSHAQHLLTAELQTLLPEVTE